MRGRGWILLGILLLFVASVPWYRETGAPVTIVFGLPDWVAVAIGCYAAIAILNCVAWLLAAHPEAQTWVPCG